MVDIRCILKIVSRRYRTGQKRVITDEFKEEVREALCDKKWSLNDLDRALKASEGSVHALLTRQQTSGLVDDICRILKISIPVQVGSELEEIVMLLRRTDEPKRKQALNVLRALLSAEPK